MNSLLLRQLKRHLGIASAADLVRLTQLLPEAANSGELHDLACGFPALVRAVDDAYEQYEREITLRSRSLDISSEELHNINRRLQQEVQSRQDTLDALTLVANSLREEAGLAELDPQHQHDVSALGEMMADLMRQRQDAEKHLQLAASVFASTNEGIVITDGERRIVSVNPAFCEVTGYQVAEVMGKTARFMQSGRHDPAYYERMWQSIVGTGKWRGEILNRRKNGEIFPALLSINAVPDSRGNITHYVGVFADISLVKESQERLAYLAHHDPVTGLANRILFNSRLEHSIQSAHREGHRLGVLFIDLDHFKDVNDTLGHQIGDELLSLVAGRLAQCVRANDTLARLGGDEFILLLEHAESPNNVSSVGEKLLATLRHPFDILGHEIYIGASIGASMYPADGETAEALVKNADAAMYQAKAHGRNVLHFYAASMTAAAMERLKLEGQLRGAIDRKELELHYQPQFDMTDGRLIGAEALVRWHHPTLGLVAPVRFIPLAEETGFIVPLGRWVLGQACRQLKAWDHIGIRVPRIAVNLSSKQFDNSDLVASVRSAIADAGIAPERLELELTESIIMECGDVLPIMEQLRALGVSISIDDFGTGYSSLSYLKHLPIDKLKIDRSFVTDIGQDANNEIIVRTIITLAKTLDLKVLAEGVETAEQARFLCREGCVEAQGYLYGKPLAAASFEPHCLAQSGAAAACVC